MNADSSWQPPAGRLRAGLKNYRADTGGCRRLVYIPTHRPFGEVLKRVAAEIGHAGRQTGDEFQMLVIDDRDVALARENHVVTAQIAESSVFAVNWLGREAWADFVEMLVQVAGLTKAQSGFAAGALAKESGSYGSGPNKASLLAAYLGAYSLHRRDSDEFPGFRHHDELTTLQVEAAALALPIPAAAEGVAVAPYFVGSDIVGEPTKDHRDLMTTAPELADQVDRISSAKDMWRSAATGSSPSYVLDVGAGVPVERDTSGKTEIGVSATREVFEWIPEMPAVGVLGTDYFQKGLLYRLDLPVLWHPLSATHVYEPSRLEQRNLASLRRYVLAELRYCILKQYWNAANVSLSAMAKELMPPSGLFRPDLYADVFRNVLDSDSVQTEAAVTEFITVHERALSLSSGEVAARLEARVLALRQARDTAVGYVQAAVVEFAELTRLWSRLVSAARAMHPT